MTIVMTFIAAAVAVILITALKGRSSSGSGSSSSTSRRDDVHSYKRKQGGRNVAVRGYQRRSRW